MPEMRLRPGPRWGSLQRSPDLLAGFKGPTSKGRGGEAREGGMGGREGRGEKGKGRGGKGRKEEGREGSEGGLTPTFLYPPLPLHKVHTITNRENFYFKVLNRLSTRIHQLDFINVLVRHSI